MLFTSAALNAMHRQKPTSPSSLVETTGNRIQQLTTANNNIYTRMMDANQVMYTQMMNNNQSLHTRIMEMNNNLHSNVMAANQSILTMLVDLQGRMDKVQLQFASLSNEVKELRLESQATAQLVKNIPVSSTSSQNADSEAIRSLILASAHQQKQLTAMGTFLAHLPPPLVDTAGHYPGSSTSASFGPTVSKETPCVSVETRHSMKPVAQGGFGDNAGSATAVKNSTFNTPTKVIPAQVPSGSPSKSSGDDGWTKLFSEHCTLYRFEKSASQWKTRGTGELSISTRGGPSVGKKLAFRLQVKRDQTKKLCANHLLTGSMLLSPSTVGIHAVLSWPAKDFSEERLKDELFAVRFKDNTTLIKFETVFNDGVKQLQGPQEKAPESTASKAITVVASQVTAGAANSFQVSSPAKPPSITQSSPFTGFGSSLATKPPQTTAAATTTTTSASTSLFSFTNPSDNKGGSLFGNLNLQSSTTEKPAFSGLFGNPAASSSFSFSTKPATEPRPHNTSVGEESDELVPEEEGDHIYFKPVLEELPEKVEVNTGEEEDEMLFCERARLYRWCPPSDGTTEGGEWKERGIGDMKLLRHKTSLQTRVVMRREQVLKVCCNHRITSSMQLRPMTGGNDRAWTWVAPDFAESLDTPELLTLAVKFRDEQTARRFQEEFMKAAEGQRTSEKSLLQGSNGEATPKTSDRQKPTSAQAPLSSAVQNGHSKKEDVIVVKAEQRMLTEEQMARARAIMFPETYFDFENEPGHKRNEDAESADVEPLAVPTATTAPRHEGLFLFANSSSTDFSSLAQSAAGKSTFGGFSQTGDAAFSWSSMKGQVFGGSSQKPHDTSDGDAGHDEAANENYDPQYEPVIALPELVPRQTGEEEDECLFEKRARLYRFADGQWKERGTGVLKVLVRKGDKPGELDYRKARLLMRREQILKLCCNHAISESCPKFTPFANSGANAACWTAQDFSEGEPKAENLAVKFKTDAEMEQFQKVVADVQAHLKSCSNE